MKKYLNPDSIANEIRMSRSQYRGAFLLVEGTTDALLFERLTSDKCQVRSSNGKDNAIKVIEILEKSNFNGVLAIVDADFWNIDNVNSPSSNILTTDGHDLETMMIFSSALDKVVAELGRIDKLKSFDKHIRDLLIEFALPIGLLRLHSAPNRRNLHLNFKKIDYCNFFDFEKKNFNIKRLVSEIVLNSKISSLDADCLCSEILVKLSQISSDVKDVCNGHDLIEILNCGLTKVFGNFRSKNLEPHLLRSILRMAYDKDCFSSSNLYKAVKKWEISNQGFTIL